VLDGEAAPRGTGQLAGRAVQRLLRHPHLAVRGQLVHAGEAGCERVVRQARADVAVEQRDHRTLVGHRHQPGGVGVGALADHPQQDRLGPRLAVEHPLGPNLEPAVDPGALLAVEPVDPDRAVGGAEQDQVGPDDPVEQGRGGVVRGGHGAS
jgi:hypothetical protein